MQLYVTKVSLKQLILEKLIFVALIFADFDF